MRVFYSFGGAGSLVAAKDLSVRMKSECVFISKLCRPHTNPDSFSFALSQCSRQNRDTFDESTKLSKRAIELNNGRAAQMGLLALMVHEKLGVSLIPQV